jgi:hypothetical protein
MLIGRIDDAVAIGLTLVVLTDLLPIKLGSQQDVEVFMAILLKINIGFESKWNLQAQYRIFCI